MPNVGSILEVNAGQYQDQIPVLRSGPSTAWTNTTITLDEGASSVDNFYVGCWINIIGVPAPTGYDPKIIAYNGTTKVATIQGWFSNPPPASQWSSGTPQTGKTWQIIRDFTLQREFTWTKDGVDIPGAIGASYTPSQPGTYGFKETAYFPNLDASKGTSTVTISGPIVVTGSRDNSLVYQEDLEYIGAFAPPSTDLGPNRNFSYSGDIAFNPAGNNGFGSIFMRTHLYTDQVGEFTIPSANTWARSDSDTVPRGTLISGGLYDPIEGQLGNSGITSGGEIDIGGLHVYNNKLLITAHGGYTYNPASWFWQRPLDLSVTGQVQGPFAVMDPVKNPNTRCFAGYMATVPSELRSRLGGPVMCGLSAQSIVSTTSDGPAIAGFDPANFDNFSGAGAVRSTFGSGSTPTAIVLNSTASSVDNFYNGWFVASPTGLFSSAKITSYNGTTKIANVTNLGTTPALNSGYVLVPPINATMTAFYGDGKLQAGQDWDYQGVFNWTGRGMVGAVVPDRTRSVMVFGKCGNGLYRYTISYISTLGKRYYSGPGTVGSDTPGEKAWPYYPRIWCYDANELNEVRLGNIPLDMVKPYAVINYTFPFKGSNEPSGVTYDPATRRLFIATLGLPGANAIIHVYQIKDISAGASVLTPPTISTTSIDPGAAGQAYTFTLSASGSGTKTWSIISGSIAPLTLNSATGQITGTPTASGTLTATFRVSSEYGTDDKAFTINVISNAPPVVVTSILPPASVGTVYNSTGFQLIATPTTPPITWTLQSGTLPAGLSLSPSGLISGTPTTSGTVSGLVFQATNSYGSGVSASLSISVSAAGTAFGIRPQLYNIGMTKGTVGTSYTSQLVASGTTPITYSITSGTLPTGLTINGSTGVISGTPTQSGEFNIIWRATNANGYSDWTSQIIIASTVAPTILTASGALPNGMVGLSYATMLVAEESTVKFGSLVWSVAIGSLPPGLTLSSGGVISGIPTATATGSSITFRATNSLSGLSNTVTMTITVAASDGTSTAPEITMTDDIMTPSTVGVSYSQTLTATGTGPITWSILRGSLGAGLTLNSTTGIISGTPTVAGPVSIIYQAKNSATSTIKEIRLTRYGIPTNVTPTIIKVWRSS